MLKTCDWNPDGYSTVSFAVGQIVSSSDPRAANGFVTVALQNGWAEPLHSDENTPTALLSPKAVARTAPSRKARSHVERTK
jgi:hypothetical protein